MSVTDYSELKLPVGAGRVTKKKKKKQNPDVVTKTWTRPVPAAVLCYTHCVERAAGAH